MDACREKRVIVCNGDSFPASLPGGVGVGWSGARGPRHGDGCLQGVSAQLQNGASSGSMATWLLCCCWTPRAARRP
jgi:hypothetical protein